MDSTFTPEFTLTEALLAKAMKKCEMPKPSTASLEFIKNFARNFRVEKRLENSFQGMVIN